MYLSECQKFKAFIFVWAMWWGNSTPLNYCWACKMVQSLRKAMQQSLLTLQIHTLWTTSFISGNWMYTYSADLWNDTCSWVFMGVQCSVMWNGKRLERTKCLSIQNLTKKTWFFYTGHLYNHKKQKRNIVEDMEYEKTSQI